MPIWLTTGLPGHGKTLRTTLEVEERRIREGRRVYYHGITDLTLDWFPLENAEDWHTVPDGSIVVIDECQRVFPVRPSGSAVPEHVQQFETHRHKGLDVILITQHPNLIDSHVRRLVERHQHVYRPFGLSYAVIMEWPAATDPQKSGAEKFAIKTRWKLDSSGFKNYKSATVHTIKKRFPRFVLLLPALGAALGLLVWLAADSLGMTGQQSAPQPASQPAPNVQQLPNINADAPQRLTATGPAPRTQSAPLAGAQVYVVGDISGELLLEVEREGRGWVITGTELTRAGYLIEQLNGCMVRLGYMRDVQYALCRGRGDGSDTREARRMPEAEPRRKDIDRGAIPLQLLGM